jgi:hypothetical protein
VLAFLVRLVVSMAGAPNSVARLHPLVLFQSLLGEGLVRQPAIGGASAWVSRLVVQKACWRCAER